MRATARNTAALITGLALVAPGCASLDTTGTTRASLAYEPGEGLRELPVFAASTQFERESQRDDDGSRRDGASKPLFWTGVIAGSLGTAGTIGFGAAGRVTENRIRDGYESGIMRNDADDLRDKGSIYNTLAITSAVVGIVGWATALIVYGVDYSRCGPLVANNKKRNCPK